jgi:acyl-CoA thioester hydrolase
MAEPFRVRIAIRPYEVDRLGHLTGAVYVQYADYARYETARAAGVSMEGLFEDGTSPINLETTIRYLGELRAGDEVDVSTLFVWGDGKTFEARQEFRRRSDDQLAAEVTSVCGLFDLAERRLRSDPAGIWRAYAQAPEVMGL